MQTLFVLGSLSPPNFRSKCVGFEEEIAEGVRAQAPPSAEAEEVRAVAPSSPQLKVASTPPRTPVAASSAVEFPKLSWDAKVEDHLYLYGFSIDDFLDAMGEGSPDGKYTKKEIGCKFMAMPLKVRIQRLEAGIHELDSMMVNGSPRFQRIPDFPVELRDHFRYLLAKSKQVS